MAVSKFKATCLSVLDRVRRTGRPLRVTRFGKPLADVVPPRDVKPVPTWMGAMRGRGRSTGDLVAPVEDAAAWNALR